MPKRYSIADKSLDELLSDLDSLQLQAGLGGGAYETAQAAIAIKVAKTQQFWTRVSSLASIVSVGVAVAAVIVAATAPS